MIYENEKLFKEACDQKTTEMLRILMVWGWSVKHEYINTLTFYHPAISWQGCISVHEAYHRQTIHWAKNGL